jgi:hypothetical protein
VFAFALPTVWTCSDLVGLRRRNQEVGCEGNLDDDGLARLAKRAAEDRVEGCLSLPWKMGPSLLVTAVEGDLSIY